MLYFLGKLNKKLWFYKKKMAVFLFDKNQWFCLRFLSFIRVVRLLEITYLDQIKLNKVVKIRAASTSSVYAPNFYGNSQNNSSVEVNLPELCLYKLENVWVRGNSSNFLTNQDVIIERVPAVDLCYCRYNTGDVLSHNDVYAAVVSKPNKSKIDKAIFLCGNGSWNYYHWLIEIIPKIKYFHEAGIIDDDLCILVPNEVNRFESFKTILNLALGGDSFDVIYLPSENSVQVDELYTITTPCNVVFDSANGSIKPEFFLFRGEVVDYLRSLVIDYISNKNSDAYFPRRIFLARHNTSARQYNQDDVISVFIKYGFDVVYPEKMNFIEQVMLFNKAEFIAGPSGAAWTNIVFCSDKTKAISWLASNLSGFSSFSSLAKYVGVDMQYVLATSRDESLFHSAYIVDCSHLRTLVAKMLSE